MASYSLAALRLLISAMAGTPPWSATQRKTRPAMYHANVGGVLIMEPDLAFSSQFHTCGVLARARPSRSSRTITTTRPDGPMFFCAPA